MERGCRPVRRWGTCISTSATSTPRPHSTRRRSVWTASCGIIPARSSSAPAVTTTTSGRIPGPGRTRRRRPNDAARLVEWTVELPDVAGVDGGRRQSHARRIRRRARRADAQRTDSWRAIRGGRSSGCAWPAGDSAAPGGRGRERATARRAAAVSGTGRMHVERSLIQEYYWCSCCYCCCDCAVTAASRCPGDRSVSSSMPAAK